MEKIANRYAESLFDLAKEQSQVKEFSKSMRFIEEVFSADTSFIRFFNHGLIDNDAKFDIIDKIFKGQLNTYLCGFLKLLISNNRIDFILEISQVFISLCNLDQGIIEGILSTPFPATLEEIRNIEKAMSNLKNMRVILKNEIDRAMVGGVKIYLENQVIDYSIKHKIEELKKELLRK